MQQISAGCGMPEQITLKEALPEALIQKLEALLGARQVLRKTSERLSYECDACVLLSATPGVVVLPKTCEQVAAIVRLCYEAEVPFVARGAGTGLSGGAVTQPAQVLIALNHLNAIEELDIERRYVWVEVGVVNARLNEYLAHAGLQYAPDPSSQLACTIGGNVAENAGGIHCFKFGVTSDHVLALEMVTPEGKVLRLGQPTPHQSAFDWMRLVVGSEGTLGIVTRVCLRLIPKPKEKRLFMAAYSKLEEASGAVAAVIQKGLQPAAMEYLDKPTVWAVNQAFSMGFPADCAAILLVEVSGEGTTLEHDTTSVLGVLQQFNPVLLQQAQGEAEVLKLWKVRKLSVAAYGQLKPAFYVHDCVVPRSKLTAILQGIETISQRYQLIIANVFHAADGNLHPNVLFNPHDKEAVKTALAAGDAILELCLSMGGTLSGEHGIGLEKVGFMQRQFSECDLRRMLWLRESWDSKGLANPGKMLPAKHTCGESGLYLHEDAKAEELTTEGLIKIVKKSPRSMQGLTQDGETGMWI